MHFHQKHDFTQQQQKNFHTFENAMILMSFPHVYSHRSGFCDYICWNGARKTFAEKNTIFGFFVCSCVCVFPFNLHFRNLRISPKHTVMSTKELATRHYCKLFSYLWKGRVQLKHRKNRKMLCRRHLIGCQGVKIFFLKDPLKIVFSS